MILRRLKMIPQNNHIISLLVILRLAKSSKLAYIEKPRNTKHIDVINSLILILDNNNRKASLKLEILKLNINMTNLLIHKNLIIPLKLSDGYLLLESQYLKIFESDLYVLFLLKFDHLVSLLV